MAQTTNKNHIAVPGRAKVVFDTAGTDSAGVSNTTTAAHGSGVFIPQGAIITNAYYNVETTFTDGASDTATIAIKVVGTGDLKAAISIAAAGDVWDAGIHGCLPGSYAEATVAGDTAVLDAARKAASYIATGTTAKEVVFTVGTAALTAGRLVLYIDYAL